MNTFFVTFYIGIPVLFSIGVPFYVGYSTYWDNLTFYLKCCFTYCIRNFSL